jgi:phage/plasmid-like protein (TIGR03299 family)
MSHEINRSKKTGRDNFVEFVEAGKALVVTAWHRLGNAVRCQKEDGSYYKVKEILDMIEAGYLVEKRPTYRTRNINNAGSIIQSVVQSDRAFVTVRTDTEDELGSVGPNYTPLQNEDAFAAAEPLIESGVMFPETGGVLRKGSDVFLLARWNLEKFGPVCREVFGDELLPYAQWTNNHSGRRSATVSEVTIRTVCANTLGMNEHAIDAQLGKDDARAISIEHTGDARLKMIEASEKLFGGVIQRFEKIAAHYKLLKECTLTDEQFRALILDPAIPDPRKHPRFNPEAKMAGLVVERYEKKVNEVVRLRVEGKGHKGDGSAWEGYNGLVEAIDHNETLFPTKGGVFRTQSLLDGTLRQMKDRALARVVKFAKTGNVDANASFDALDDDESEVFTTVSTGWNSNTNKGF